MPISDKKITTFTKQVADLADKPNQGGGMTAAQVKAQFDAAPEELRGALNGLIDMLLGAVAGDSGAHNIGSAAIAGVSGANVYDQLANLRQLINDTAAGTIPDGSITPVKLSETAKAAQNISVADMNAHFTSTNVEGALDELFTFANDGKTQVASAVTAKGVAASSTDSFSTLATKIGQISTGKKLASGTATAIGTKVSVRGLSFRPSTIILNNTARAADYTRFSLYVDKVLFSSARDINSIVGPSAPAQGTIALYADGFDINGDTSGGNYSWIAYE